MRDGKPHAHIFDKPQAPYLNDEFLNSANEILEQAERQAENDVVRFRIQTARLPIWYVQLADKRVAGETRADLLKKFLEIARKAGVSNVNESRSLDDWAKTVEAK